MEDKFEVSVCDHDSGKSLNGIDRCELSISNNGWQSTVTTFEITKIPKIINELQSYLNNLQGDPK